MKKVLFLLLTFVIVASALGIQVQGARAEGYITYERMSYVEGKGIVYVFLAEGFHTRDIKGAKIYVGSDLYDLFCWVTEDKEHIECNAQDMLLPFQGQTAIIYLAGYIFYVTIPHRGSPAEDSPLVCADGLVPGADVLVLGFGTYFVPGSTLDEVQSQAESWFAGEDIEIVSSLYCSEEPG